MTGHGLVEQIFTFLRPGIHCVIFVQLFWVGTNFSFVVRRFSCSVQVETRSDKSLPTGNQTVG